MRLNWPKTSWREPVRQLELAFRMLPTLRTAQQHRLPQPLTTANNKPAPQYRPPRRSWNKLKKRPTKRSIKDWRLPSKLLMHKFNMPIRSIFWNALYSFWKIIFYWLGHRWYDKGGQRYCRSKDERCQYIRGWKATGVGKGKRIRVVMVKKQ